MQYWDLVSLPSVSLAIPRVQSEWHPAFCMARPRGEPLPLGLSPTRAQALCLCVCLRPWITREGVSLKDGVKDNDREGEQGRVCQFKQGACVVLRGARRFTNESLERVFVQSVDSL